MSDEPPQVTAHEAAELATEETVEVDGEDILDAEIVPTPGPTLPGTTLSGTPGTGVPAPAFDYTDDGVPTLDYVRDRIEKRWGTAQGSAEIAGAAEAAEHQQQQDAEREKRAADRLAEIRRGLAP